ncbi:MAG: c-type cytochrome domain-containing protein [Kofleriaceae bacterium]|nr:c-type cytochrome domain-containing protein [Kofleriaceae bacterium]
MRSRLFAAALGLLAGCKDSPPACTSVAIDLDCATQYSPSFDNVYLNTIDKRCGTRDGSCHSASGDADLSFATREAAYASLLAGHVMPGDPACSELIVRTLEAGTDYAMPPETPLSELDRCALVKWVNAGAPGPGVPFPTAGAAR